MSVQIIIHIYVLESGIEWSRVEIATMTRFCESVNGILLCMKNRVCKCNREGIASLMSRNERIRMVPSMNSRSPTRAHCEFNGHWSGRLYGLCWGCNALHSCLSVVHNGKIEVATEVRECC